jgi:dsDNA-specific endonuclease/ATPase MutS2
LKRTIRSLATKSEGEVSHIEQRGWQGGAAEREFAPVSNDEPVEIPITDTLDLHPFRPGEVADVAREYLLEAYSLGMTQVRLIHGRGIGVQRERIRAVLRELDFVLDFHDADGSGGGWGATVVLLASNSLKRD